MILISVSDLHLGKGKYLECGSKNILEEFDESPRFQEFLDFYSSEEYLNKEVTLVLNGDIFNLIQIDHDGVFPTLLTEEIAAKSMQKIILGHPIFFKALKDFLSKSKKQLVYIIGNHDICMVFDKVKEVFSQAILQIEQSTNNEKISFHFEKIIGGVHFEHGHRFESLSHVPLKKLFVKGPANQPIINLPWGSLFCISILPMIKKERPNIDKIRPVSIYIKWCLLHDFFFLLRLVYLTIGHVYNISNHSSFLKTFKIRSLLKTVFQFSSFPGYEKQAKVILRKNPKIHTVVMGHTHVLEWRKFANEKYYFNTGTWLSLPSVDQGLQDKEDDLSYLYLELDQNRLIKAESSRWMGKWRPYRVRVHLTS